MRKRWIWLGILVAVAVGVIALDSFIDEPVRRRMERELNARLKGYTVTLRAADLHLFGFALDLEDWVVVQDANPKPPVASIPRLTASVQWRELLRARVVADFRVVRPAIHVDRRHVTKEARDRTPIEDRGWQDALEAIYPLKINEFKVVDGDLTYVDASGFKPLRLSRVNILAGNIRNIRAPQRTYPSHIFADAVVFDSGSLAIDGHADFLAKPHPGVNANIKLKGIDLGYFKPVVGRYNVSLQRGTLSAAGRVEYAPDIQVAELKTATIDGVRVDYIHTAGSRPAEQRATRTAVRAVKKASNDPELQVRVKELKVVNSTLGFVNKARRPEYRVFVSDTSISIENVSNHFAKGPATARVTGRFMGSGDTAVDATFRPDTKGPDFDLRVRIDNTQLPAMNDLLRAYGKFDVVRGLFSFYSELKVKDQTIGGYVKPLFRDLDVYDKRQDREKSVFRKLYEGLVGGIANLLENRPREEVATQAEISGRVDDPEASTWQVVVRLVQNAFFKAILPGFDRELERPRVAKSR
jgi:hypothetical protein